MSSQRLLSILLVALTLAPGSVARAQGSLVLIPEHADPDELEQLVPLLRAELGFSVRVGHAPREGETTVRVTVRGSSAELAMTRADGVRVERATTLPVHAAARTHALVALTSNLALDQTSDLLAAYTPRSTAPSGEAPERGEEPAAPAPEDPLVRHREGRVGLSAHVGTAPTQSGGVVAWGLAGVDAVWAPIPEIAIGVRDFVFFHDETDWVVHLAPVVELSLRPLRWLGLHAIVGADIQSIFDGASPDAVAGVAARLSLGARVYIVPELSIAADATLRVVATDTYRTIMTPFPAEAVLLSFSTSFAYHF